MKNRISRRDFNRLLGAGAAFGAVGGLAGRAAAETRLRLIWWGNPDRDRRTNEVVDLYHQKFPEVAIAPENYQWGDYWQKLATQAAGGNLPDVIQMDYRFIFEYARRGQLAELDPFVGRRDRPRRLRREPAQLGQGRRKALRHLDGREFHVGVLQQDQVR